MTAEARSATRSSPGCGSERRRLVVSRSRGGVRDHSAARRPTGPRRPAPGDRRSRRGGVELGWRRGCGGGVPRQRRAQHRRRGARRNGRALGAKPDACSASASAAQAVPRLSSELVEVLDRLRLGVPREPDALDRLRQRRRALHRLRHPHPCRLVVPDLPAATQSRSAPPSNARRVRHRAPMRVLRPSRRPSRPHHPHQQGRHRPSDESPAALRRLQPRQERSVGERPFAAFTLPSRWRRINRRCGQRSRRGCRRVA